jgi:hypothetical protein
VHRAGEPLEVAREGDTPLSRVGERNAERLLDGHGGATVMIREGTRWRLRV